MSSKTRNAILGGTLFVLGCAGPLTAQQKPQWMPGQMGMNAGILPDPGLTYVNITIDYSSGTFNGPNGKAIPVTGSYDVWGVENGAYYVPNFKFLGGHFGYLVMLTPATGSLAADLVIPSTGTVTNIGGVAGGSGLADLWVQPFTVGWHLKRADLLVADALMVPSGRYNPGATNNVGTGYVGNHLQTGSTLYLTKNKGTSANLFTDWEVHGSRLGTNNTYKTPGQAFTMEWGLGQVIPLKKDFSQLFQIGVVGYDQWQVTANGGQVPLGPLAVPASLIPYYSVHAIGGQGTFILPKKNLSIFLKGYHEYLASSHFLGTSFVFGGVWTLKFPKS
jgi:hypothetical protein